MLERRNVEMSPEHCIPNCIHANAHELNHYTNSNSVRCPTIVSYFVFMAMIFDGSRCVRIFK